MSTTSDLAVRAAYLARMAPREWNDFLGAFAAYSKEQTTNCIQSALEELPRAQGRAQIAALLHETFADCIKIADKKEK